jgi:hypothetical protein
MIMAGIITTASASDVCTIKVKVGGVTMATLDSPGKTLTDECWKIDGFATLKTVGATGNMAYHIHMEIEDDKNDTCSFSDTVDTTTAEDITVTVQWNAAKAGNTITIAQGFVEYKN